MRSSDVLAPLFLAASTLAQGPPVGIAPASKPPAGCEPNSASDFTIGTLPLGNSNSKRDTAAADGALVCNLNQGILRDSLGRIGSVVANNQFQFDGPPQAGAIYTGGFSICGNGSLAIGGSTRWWQCSSGGFYNLYDKWIGAQCEEIRIQVAMTGDHVVSVSSAPAASASASGSASPSMMSTEVASVQTTLATISGPVSIVSETAIGPTASMSSGNMSATATDSMMSMSTGMSMPTMSGTATTSASPSSSETGSPDAPEAGGAAPASFGVARGSMLGAFVVIFGAALVL